MVLVGDACHKMTPNAGLGFNNGVQDAVVLGNNLRRLLKGSSGPNPCSDTITSVFEQYQSSRKAAARKDVTFSIHLTRIQAWANSTYRLIACWVLPHRIIQRLLARYAGSGYKRGEIISYIPADDLFSGSMPWYNTMPLKVRHSMHS